MGNKNDSFESIITEKWLEKYMQKTQKYNSHDWYLALSIRKKAYDCLTRFYNHPRKWLSFPKHLTFSSPQIKEKLARQFGPAWKDFIFTTEENLSSLFQFQKEYPSTDKYDEKYISGPFTIIDFIEENSLEVLIITPENSCRQYQAKDIATILFLHDVFSKDTYDTFEATRPEPSETIEHLNILSEKIKSGDILEIPTEKINMPSFNSEKSSNDGFKIAPFAVNTLTQNQIFHHVINTMEDIEKKHTKTRPPEEPGIDWGSVYFPSELWSTTSEQKSVLAEINLMKSDSEIRKEFQIWLKSTRKKLRIPQPKRSHIDNYDTETVKKELSKTLALAFIDMKIIEFATKNKISESHFFKKAYSVTNTTKTHVFLSRYEKLVKEVITKAMSTDFIKHLEEQVQLPSLEK